MAAMKHLGVCVALAWASFIESALAGSLDDTPITKVVTLLGELKAKIEVDGQSEQQSYDKYACWCEDTLGTKASDISTAKGQIEDMQTTVMKLKGDLGAHGAEIKQLKKDTMANVESQREATEIREKESTGYQEEKTESEQCIGALEAAIRVLAGTGTKKGFLETLQEAQLLSVVAGVRGLLRRPLVARSVSDKDLQVVRHFVSRPEDFVGGRTGILSAAQIANNPFGDYAPQSTQIQGILKGMYDSFAADLERSNADESSKQKGFEELMATKQQELKTLQGSLEVQTMDEAEKTKRLADGKTTLDDTKAQLAADEAFFADTKGSCQIKARDWASRTRLRTEELAGIAKATAILSTTEAEKVFKNATTTLVQVSAHVHTANGGGRADPLPRLKALATRYRSVSLAKIAAQVEAGGHFDKVIASIDSIVALLRREEQSDIDERDWCQGKQTKNTIDMEDLNHDITKAGQALTRMADKAGELGSKIQALANIVNATKSHMEELDQLRHEDKLAFMQAVKDDTDAVALLEQAIVALSKFYQSNGIPVALEQQPETSWQDGSYGGRKSESGGIIAILALIKEDLEKEIITSGQQDVVAQTHYESDRQAMQAAVDAYLRSQTAASEELADLNLRITDTEGFQSQKTADLGLETGRKATLHTNCAWVQTHFQSRREKRKAEIDGLVEAKNFLAGVELSA